MVWLADNYDAIYQRAQYLNRTGDREGAIRELSRLVDRLSRLSSSLLERKPNLNTLKVGSATILVELLAQASRYDEAIELGGKLAEWDSANKESWRRQVAALLIQKGDTEGGLEYLRRLGEENPKEYLNWLALTSQIFELKRPEGAQEFIEKALGAARRLEETAHIWFTLADLYRQAKLWDQAGEAWEKMAASSPGGDAGPLWIYSMYIENQDYPKAREYLAKETNKFLANFYSGLVSWREGNQAGATRTWRMMVPWEPGEALAEQEAWAEAALRTGNASRMVSVISKYLVAEKPASLKLVLLLGLAQAATGAMDAARASLAQVRRSAADLDEEVKQKMREDFEELLGIALADEILKAMLHQTMFPAPQDKAE